MVPLCSSCGEIHAAFPGRSMSAVMIRFSKKLQTTYDDPDLSRAQKVGHDAPSAPRKRGRLLETITVAQQHPSNDNVGCEQRNTNKKSGKENRDSTITK